MEPEEIPSNVQLSVAIKTDRDVFLRRTCPSCGRDFKTEANPAFLQWALESYCRRAGVPIGERPSPEGAPTRIHCPYCEAENELNQTYTEETVAYLNRILYRDFVLPQMKAMFAGLEDSMGSRHSGGMFSISVEFKHNRGVQPVRPIHGPDPAEFKIIAFLCCGGKIKVSETYNGLRLCPFCAAEVAVV